MKCFLKVLYMIESTDRVIERVHQQLPAHFPAQVADTILNGLKARATRLA